MTRSALLLSLAAALAACTPTVSGSTNAARFLKPGQTWLVSATDATGAAETFDVRLRDDAIEQDGMVGYADIRPDANGDTAVRGLAYYSPGELPERFVATLARPGGSAHNCVIVRPSQAGSTTAFTGLFETQSGRVDASFSSGDKSGLGTCTLTLQR